MTDLLNIAKECGAKDTLSGKLVITHAQLHATVEKVCKPLIEALNRAIDDDPAYILVCCQAESDYTNLMGHGK